MKFKNIFPLLAFVAILMMTGCDNDQPNLNRAAIMAQDIVTSSFAADCDFDDMDIRGEETTPGNFTVYQKFTTSKYPGDEFVYKIKMEHQGGDWAEASNWSHGSLIIENCLTGEQYYY